MNTTLTTQQVTHNTPTFVEANFAAPTTLDTFTFANDGKKTFILARLSGVVGTGQIYLYINSILTVDDVLPAAKQFLFNVVGGVATLVITPLDSLTYGTPVIITLVRPAGISAMSLNLSPLQF